MKNKSLYLKLLACILGIALIIIGINLDKKGNISPKLAQEKIENYLNKQTEEALSVISDTNKLKEIINSKTAFEEEINLLKNKPYSILIYEDFALKFWSSNKIIPNNIKRLFSDSFSFIKLNNGYYIVLKNNFSESYTAIALIPVYYTYNIQNKYLKKGFSFDSDLCNYEISEKENNSGITLPDGATKIYIKQANDTNQDSTLGFANFVLIALGLLVTFIFSINLVYLVAKASFIRGILIASFLSILSVFIFINLNINTPIFDVSLYTSPYFGKTLAHTLFGLIMLLWWIIILYPFLFNLIKLTKSALGYIFSLFVFAIHAILLITILFLLEGMINHSIISFDFFNFFSLNLYSFLAIFIYSISFLILYFLSKILFSWIQNFHWLYTILVQSVFITIGALAISNWCKWEYSTIIVIYIIYIVYLTFEDRLDFIRMKSSKYLILISIFALLTSHIILTNVELRNISQKKKTVTKLLFDRNYLDEYKFIEIGEGISEDNFVKTHFSNPYILAISLEERIKKSYFNSFSQKYDIDIFAFNFLKNTLSGPIQKSFEELELEFTSMNFNSDTESPFFKFTSDKNNKHKYIGKFEIKNESQLLGYLFIEMTPKAYSSSSIYPELLVDGSYTENPFDLITYAIYKNDKLISSNGDYDYTDKLLFDSGLENQYIYYKEGNFVHLLYRGLDDAVVIISEEKTSGLQNISVFSYSFCFYLLIMVIFFWIKNSFSSSNEEKNKVNNSLQKNIQISIVSLTLLFLVVVGIVTVAYFEKQYDAYHNQRLVRKVTTLMKNIDLITNPYQKSDMDSFNVFIEKNLIQLAETHTLDINIFDRNGKLSYTTQPEIFKKEIQSEYISPAAFVDIIIKEKQRSVISENIDKLTYLSAYVPFGEYDDKALSYFHFPYYSKEKNIRSEISYFIVALMNVYVILILFATFVATIVARSITTPLSVIQQNIQNLQLGKKNTTIKWQKNDEIGLLIKEYNRMVEELEKSAKLLAKSERESAWREMAKQVAHEIKNPLTPMKLSIQHLQRAIKENRNNVEEMTIKVAERLIEQIDTLSHIATEFSSFAKMPQAQNETMELTKIISSAANLFQDYPQVDIIMNIPNKECFIFADRNQIMRVFNNILTNAVQAIPLEEKGTITIDLNQKEEVFLIKIKDNGVGIPESMKYKVFEPNFTTKNSGTGLGLAITRNIIEKANGKIWFKSEENVGTTFYIILPKSK